MSVVTNREGDQLAVQRGKRRSELEQQLASLEVRLHSGGADLDKLMEREGASTRYNQLAEIWGKLLDQYTTFQRELDHLLFGPELWDDADESVSEGTPRLEPVSE